LPANFADSTLHSDDVSVLIKSCREDFFFFPWCQRVSFPAHQRDTGLLVFFCSLYVGSLGWNIPVHGLSFSSLDPPFSDNFGVLSFCLHLLRRNLRLFFSTVIPDGLFVTRIPFLSVDLLFFFSAIPMRTFFPRYHLPLFASCAFVTCNFLPLQLLFSPPPFVAKLSLLVLVNGLFLFYCWVIRLFLSLPRDLLRSCSYRSNCVSGFAG